ncbi:hypothetical protein BD414DRAFT_51488 [Trametes punicea]|nr:hypothetical protein BD414DRAFT_51488 [Trametes punicea]
MAPTRTLKKPKIFECDVCGELFAGDLSRHKRTHGDPIFFCPWPGCKHPGSRQWSNMKNHIEKWHLVLRKYTCPHQWVDEYGRVSDCVANFDEPGALTRHRKLMHGYDPWNKDKEVGVRLRYSSKQEKDRYYYEVVVKERTAARLAEAGLTSQGFEAMFSDASAFMKPASCRVARTASSSSTSSASSAASSSSTASSLSSASSAPSDYISLFDSLYTFDMGEGSSNSFPNDPTHNAPANDTTLGFPPTSVAQFPGLQTNPQAQSFLDVIGPADMLLPSQVPTQFFDMPLPQPTTKSQFTADWNCGVQNSSLTSSMMPAMDFGLGMGMGMGVAVNGPNVLSMDMPAAPKKDVFGWDACFYAPSA